MVNATIHEFVEKLLVKRVKHGRSAPVGLTYREILKAAKRKYPRSAINNKHLSWYASRLRARKLRLPARPRTHWQAA